MKRALTLLLAAGVGFAAAMFWTHRPSPTPATHEAETTPAVPEAGDAPTKEARSAIQPRRPAPPPPTAEESIPVPARRGPQELLDELVSIQVTPGPGQARAQYRVLALLDQLAQAGPSALPAIRQFLASGRDVGYGAAGGGGRGGSRNALLPPSLRFGLFDVVRQIGGADSERILAACLASTGRGTELTYLAQLLEELSPSQYRDAALTAARSLLTGGKVTDPGERNTLFDVLRQFNDVSYVATAQANLVQADGKVDRSALRYLQQSLGEQSVALAVQTYQDARVADSDSKEALGRVALNYVGASDQALELYHKATLDPQLKPDQRRELVEDLNQDGLSNKRNPTAEDLKIIANRYALTQAYLQQDYVQNDKTLNAAFLEANKDLANILESAGVAPVAQPPGK